MDMIATNPLRDELMKSDQNFRELVQQHQNYEQRLDELANLTYPSDEEQLEESTLKKKKLALKDKIYTIIDQHSKKISH